MVSGKYRFYSGPIEEVIGGLNFRIILIIIIIMFALPQKEPKEGSFYAPFLT